MANKYKYFMKLAFNKILLAFDNSGASRVALQKACDIAGKFDSEITVLFVSSGKEQEFSDSKKFLEDFTSSKGINLSIVEKTGKVYDEVIKLEKAGDYGLILVGAHGKSGWQPLWMGSNAFKVISSSNCPVISSQEKAGEIGFDQIVLPITNSSNTRQKVPYCALIAKAFNSTVHILATSKSKSNDTVNHVNSYLRQTERYLAEKDIKYTSETKFAVKVPETCIEYAKQVGAGLMLIMTDTESSGIFMDSYSQQLVNHSPVPIMTIHSRDTRLAGKSGY